MKKQKSIDFVDQETGLITPAPKFKTQYNADAFPVQGEINISPSLAIPNQSLTVQEIIKRHTRGLPIFQTDLKFQDQDDPLGGRDIRSMDLEEVAQIARESRARYKEAQEKYMAEQRQKQIDGIREDARQEYIKHQQKLQQTQPPPPEQ